MKTSVLKIALMLTIPLLCLPICTAQDLRATAADLSQHISASGRKSVAVTDFTDLDGNPTELGRYLAEEFSDALFAEAKGFEVIDRTHLKAILQEHKLATTGLIDPSTARMLGQIAGVDTLVTGTITPFEEYVHLSVKVLDTETARILAADTIDVPRTKTISDLIAAAAGGHQGPSGSQKGQILVHPSTEVQGILAVADSCTADGQVLTCTVTLTSHQQDMNIRFGAGANNSGRWVHSEAYDDSGVEYGSDAITFAGKTSYPYAETSGLLVADTPTHLVMKFNQFSSTSAKVTLLTFLLEVFPSGGGYRQSSFNLRNISIQR